MKIGRGGIATTAIAAIVVTVVVVVVAGVSAVILLKPGEGGATSTGTPTGTTTSPTTTTTTPTTTTTTVGEIDLGPEDNGRILDVSAGTTVFIRLPENPSTGYTWQYALNENITEMIEDNYIPPEDQIPGRGGTRMLKLRVVGSGEVTMDYVQPWVNQPANHFSVTFILI